ncbi:MAG: LysR family transcriptional regulator [Enterocloster clostridioformis]
MDLKQLEYIIAIADYGNITKAAEALFITQSGLNQQLIRLEKELNIQLFERNKRHLHLTQAGEISCKSRPGDDQTQTQRILYDPGSTTMITGDIFWGLPFEHGVDMFLHVSTAFNKRYPGITIHLEEHIVSATSTRCSPRDFWTWIFVMLTDKDKLDNEYIHLCNEKLVLGIPIQHPMAQYAAPPGSPQHSSASPTFATTPSVSCSRAPPSARSLTPFTHAGFQPNLFCEIDDEQDAQQA